MRKFLPVVALIATFGLVSSAKAAEPNPVDTGTWEMTLSGSGTSNTEFDAGGVSGQLTLGYFLTPNWEVFGRQTLTYADGGDSSSWQGSTRVGIDYNFNLGSWVPFVGVNIGYNYGDTNDTWQAAPEVGVRYFVNSTTFIFAQAEYQFFFNDADDANEAFDDGSFVYSLGLGFRF